MRILRVLIVLVVVLYGIHLVYETNKGSSTSNYDSMENRELTQYHFLEKNGSPQEVCSQAGLLKTMYSQVQNTAAYKNWQTNEYLDCWFASKDSDPETQILWRHDGKAKECKDDYYKDRGYCQK